MLCQIANDLNAGIDRQSIGVENKVVEQCIVPIEVERGAYRT